MAIDFAASLFGSSTTKGASNIRTLTLEQIVLSLTGPIDPVGETTEDNARFENLKELCDLTERLIAAIEYVQTRNQDHYQSSNQRAGQHAAKFFVRIGANEK